MNINYILFEVSKRRYSVESRTRKYIKRYGFLPFARNLSNKYGKQFLDTATETGLDALKTASKKVVHEAVKATGEFIGNKIADKIVKPDENLINVEEIRQSTFCQQEYKV